MERKTMRRIVVTAVLLIAIAFGACAVVLSGGLNVFSGDGRHTPRTAVLNAAIDASGIKGRIDSELRSQADSLSAQLGIPSSYANSMIDDLDIQDWTAIEKPNAAKETGTYDFTVKDVDLDVTLYDDPSIVSVEAYGQPITMEVPDSAQNYLTYVPYLQYVL